MTTPTRHILVTSALPYANGPIHLGHMLEHIQTDIWVRFQKMQGHVCTYVCADDAHGTPIMLNAQKLGITPEALIIQSGQEHRADFADFHIGFDNYHSTHSPENRELAELIYQRLRDKGYIATRTIKRPYDESKQMFLPDRFIKGECPRCSAVDQYGDNCEVCGATYTPSDLKNPRSVLSGTKPIEKDTEQYFFQLGKLEPMLREWTTTEHVQATIRHKLDEWFATGLQDWEISRDAPYWGFEIPGAPGKYFYVWLDAPIGYMASFKNLCDKNKKLNFDDYWKADSQYELYHFIGKDIAYFHTLFWPAMLHGAGFRTPTAVFCHGFLTVNNQKMSKTRGTFIKARTYLDHLNPEYLRYYFAAKLSDGIDDLDLNLEDFTARVNSDLIGKYVNIASRAAGFIHKHFAGYLTQTPGDADDKNLRLRIYGEDELIRNAYEERRYGHVVHEVMRLADLTNQYFDKNKPWALAKDPAHLPQLHQVCSECLNAFRVLTIYLSPILPKLAEQVAQFLNIAGKLNWAHLTNYPTTRINEYTHLATRIDPKQVQAVLNASKENLQMTTDTQPTVTTTTNEAIKPEISIDDFNKVDLRIAKIVAASFVEGADKLLQLTVDLGEGKTRNIFAGIRSAYDPATLVGRLTVVVANLTPRKMKFGLSEGMVLAAGPGGKELWILSPDTGAQPGMRIK